MNSFAKNATLAIRLTSLLSALLCLWKLASQAVEFAGEMDISYLSLFLRSEVAGPVIGFFLSVGFYLGSRRLGQWLTRDLSGE